MAGVVYDALHSWYVLGKHVESSANRLRPAEPVKFHHAVLDMHRGVDRVSPRFTVHRCHYGTVDLLVGQIIRLRFRLRDESADQVGAGHNPEQLTILGHRHPSNSMFFHYASNMRGAVAGARCDHAIGHYLARHDAMASGVTVRPACWVTKQARKPPGWLVILIRQAADKV
jgi:hypothetical protein